jgi:predicted hotdog family 3-hydroxylacyl-ACP dehydratase
MNDLARLSIDTFIPHRGVMRLIDRLLEADEEHAVAEADIGWDSPFVRGPGVPAWFGIEYMAQTVAAWAGHRARASGSVPRIGLLLGSRNFMVTCERFDVGQVLRIEVHSELAGETSGVGLFECAVLQHDKVLASARLAVYEPGDADPFLERLAS